MDQLSISTMRQTPSELLYLFDDNIWFNIFGLFGNEYGVTRRVNPKEFCPKDLFQAMCSVSKEFQARLLRYVQQVPQKFYYSEDLSLFSWFCLNRLKLEAIDFYRHDGQAVSFCLWMLKTCNTDHLESLKANFYKLSDLPSNQNSSEGDHKFALLPDGIKGLFSMDDQSRIIALLAKHAKKIKSLQIGISSSQLKLPFFMMNKDTNSCLEELIINIPVHHNNDFDLQGMYQNISNLRLLKKLTLVGQNHPSSSLWSRHTINSASLEEIDVRECEDDFIVSECVCPSLRVFKGKFIPRKHWKNGVIGAKAVPIITKAEVREKIMLREFVDFDSDYYGYHTLEYRVGSRPFSGMVVPDSCVVRIDVVDYASQY
jgi:hypothetical protein